MRNLKGCGTDWRVTARPSEAAALSPGRSCQQERVYDLRMLMPLKPTLSPGTSVSSGLLGLPGLAAGPRMRNEEGLSPSGEEQVCCLVPLKSGDLQLSWGLPQHFSRSWHPVTRCADRCPHP